MGPDGDVELLCSNRRPSVRTELESLASGQDDFGT